MKSMLLTAITITFALVASAQADKLYRHNGQTESVKVVKVNEYTIAYTYPGETAEQLIGKYAVAKIGYGSGRTEPISEKVVASGGPDAWDNVMIIEDKGAVLGLKKIGDVRGKTSGLIGFHTAGSADKKSMKKLKQEAAEMGASFVLITAEKDNQWTTQSIKRGIGYSY